MLQLPPLPTWDSLHPLIIHFPIVLLLISPVLTLIGILLSPAKGRPYLAVALGLLLLGTFTLVISYQTGKAAGELAEVTPESQAALQTHKALAEETRNLFLGLSVMSIAFFFLPRWVRQPEAPIYSTVLPLSFLICYMVGVLFLINTAHEGGRLVHEYGIHAILPHAGPSASENAMSVR